MGKDINNKKVYTRDVLLSTGEFTKEVVIRDGGREFYESYPIGSTLGNNEASIKTINKSLSLDTIDFDKVLYLKQNDFDKIVFENLNSQISTALSLAHFKFLSSKAGFLDKDLYNFISKYYKTSNKFPVPTFNILNGGKHVGNKLSFCEFMIIPNGKNIKENIRIASEVYNDLNNVILKKYGPQNVLVGGEGGFAPNISSVESALGLVRDAINIRNSNKCDIGIDVSANSFSEIKFNKNKSIFNYFLEDRKLSTKDLINFFVKLLKKFPEIKYLEDPFNEEDINGWSQIIKKNGKKIMIVGDDLTVTNIEFLKQHKGLINSCILKINQIGSLSQTVEAFNFCKKHKIKTIISQRSGETDSDFISHLSIGLGSDYIKAGAPARERIVKYNSLIRIFDSLSE